MDEEQPTKSSKIDDEKLQSMILDAEDEIEMLIEGRAPKNPKANIEIKDVTSDFIGEGFYKNFSYEINIFSEQF